MSGNRAYAGDSAHRGKVVSEAEFRRLWADTSLTQADIGQMLGVTPQAVAVRAKRRGLPPRRQQAYAALCVLPVDEFRAMWLAGVMTKDIVAHFGCSHPTPKNTARRLGLPFRGKSWQHKGITLDEYRQMQLAKAMAEEAARREARMRNVGRRVAA